MKKIIVFDTDFIIKNIKDLNELLSKFVNIDCFVCEVSLHEVAKYNSFDKIGLINKKKINAYEIENMYRFKKLEYQGLVEKIEVNQRKPDESLTINLGEKDYRITALGEILYKFGYMNNISKE